MNSSSSKIISTIVGVVVIVLIVVGLVWLSNNQGFMSVDDSVNNTQEPSPEEVAAILEELAKPQLDSEGKPIPPPTAAQTEVILKGLAESSTQTSSSEDLTQAEIDEIIKQLQAN